MLEAREVQTTLAKERSIHASFCLPAGQALQVSGPSGCGKTTLLRMLARLDARQGGELLLKGTPAAQVQPTRWRRQVLYLAQQPVMFEGTVAQNLLAGFDTTLADAPGSEHQAEATRLLEALLLEPEELLEQEARTLSVGEAARVALCRALLIQPAVLLADEPTASLDPDAASTLVALLQQRLQQGMALVLVAHDEAPWAELRRKRLELDGRAGGNG